MSRHSLLFTDMGITEDYILNFTKNDPDLCEYYDLVTEYLYINSEDAEEFIEDYANMHDIIPQHIAIFNSSLKWPRYMSLNDEGKHTTRCLHYWFFTFLKKFLKISNVWYSYTSTHFIPKDPKELIIIEVDVNDRLSKIETMDHFETKKDVYYKFVDRETEKT